MSDSLNTNVKGQYDNDDSGGSLNTNLSDFLKDASASGNSINSKWRNWASGEGTSLNSKINNTHGDSGSFNSRWRAWLNFITDNLKLYLDFNYNKSNTLKFPSEGSTSFDGSDDNIAISHSSDLSFGTNPHTISAWAKLDVLANFKTIISKRQAGGTATDYNLSVGANGIVYTYNGSATAQTATGVISTGSWFHYALVYDGSAYQLYINGSAVAWASGTTTSGASNSHDVAIGWDRTGNYWDGQIANVALWSRELSPEEIQSIQNKSYSQLKGVEKTSLVSWWALDTDFNDSKGSNNGTNNGATINNTVYGGNAPILPRAVDVAKEGQADNIGNGSASFNGDTDYVEFGTDVYDFSSGDFTLTAWIYHDTANTDHAGIFGVRLNDGNSSNTEVQLYIDKTNDTLASWNGSSNVNSTSAIPDKEWTHVALVQSGSNKKFYINGILDNTVSQGNGNQTSTATFKIGWTGSAIAENFLGNISQAGIWAGELSQAQIQSVLESTSYSKIPADVKSTLSQRVTNGSFDADSDWSKGTGWSINATNGTASADGTSGFNYLSQSNIFDDASATYKMTITIDSAEDLTNAGIVRNGTVQNFLNAFGITSVGTHIVYFKNSTANLLIYSNGVTTTISNISIEKVTNDIVAYYPLDGDSSRGNGTDNVVTGETLGSELLTSYDFTDTSQWNQVSNLTRTSATSITATADNGTIRTLTSSFESTTKLYKINIQGSITTGSITLKTWGGQETYKTGITGTFNENVYAFTSYGGLQILLTANTAVATITSLSIKEVTSNTGVLK